MADGLGLYSAPVFDGRGEDGLPTVDRPWVHPQDVNRIVEYLKSAPVVLAARERGVDVFDPDTPPPVPLTSHTDGTWVWSGATPYYLDTRRIPPPPQLVKHIRANAYQVPEVSEAARSAALRIATGEDPPLPIPPYRPRVITDAERHVLDRLRERLEHFGVPAHQYGILERKIDADVLEPEPDGTGWQINYWEAGRGPGEHPAVFRTVSAAAFHLLGDLLYHLDVKAAPEPSFDPLPDEPPHSLLRDRVQIELVAGTELDRFGEPGGNLVYAARTMYANRSLPPDFINRSYHVYRVERALPALTGIAVPWFGQPGGGQAFFLAAPIEELLANGSLVEIREATTEPLPPEL